MPDITTAANAARYSGIVAGKNTGDRNHAKVTNWDKQFESEQFFNEEERDDDDFSESFKNALFLNFETYSYIPVFSTENKHFLVHFISAIKDSLPGADILFQVFRI
jgi:hypothetical protein